MEMGLLYAMFWKLLVLLPTVIIGVYSQPMFDYEGQSPVLDDTLVTVTVKTGHRAVLPCHVTNAGSITITWMTMDYEQLSTNEQMIGGDQRMSIQSKYDGEYNLVIDDVQTEDAGTYQCLVQFFPPQMKDVILTVTEKAKIDKSALREMYKIMEGSLLNIVCQVQGFPRPDVHWYVYRTDPLTKEEKKELFSGNETLNIKKLNRNHQGIYSCEAENSLGKDYYEVYIDPMYKPKVVIQTPEVRVKYGSHASLSCEVESNPLSEVKWMRNGLTLVNNWKYELKMGWEISETKKMSELTIRNVEASDNGEYKCSSYNNVGKDEQTVNMIVVLPTPTARTTTTEDLPTTSKTTTDSTVTPGRIEAGTTEVEKPKTGPSSNSGNTLFTNTLSLLLPVFIVLLITTL